jgi:citrate synthase
VLESAIALIDGQRLYYRGHDAVALARERTFEEVVSLIWTGRLDGMPKRPRESFPPARSALLTPQAPLPFIGRAQSALAAAAADDPAAFDTRLERVVVHGPLRGLGRRQPLRRGDRRAGRPGRPEARRRQRPRRGDAAGAPP